MGGSTTGSRRRPSAAAARGAAPPPPDPFELLLTELKIAMTVAGSLVLVIMARRWAGRFLGESALHPDILAGGALGSLVGQVERGFQQQGKARRGRDSSPAGSGSDPSSTD